MIRYLLEHEQNESAPEIRPEPKSDIQSDMSTAPLPPQQFLAESLSGDWVVVQRYDPGKPGDYSKHFVISRRLGRWWDARRWRPLDPASPAFGRDR